MNKGFYMTLMIGPMVPVPVPRPVLEALNSVQVTSTTEGRGGFQLQFRLSRRSPVHTLLLLGASQVPWLRSIVIVTVNGTPHVLADGLITRQEMAPAGDSGQSMLTVTGEDLTVAMDQQEFSGTPYPSMPPVARVALIIGKYAMFGMVPLVVPPIFNDVPLPVQQIPAHQGTDLAYVNQLAAEVGHVFYVEPGPAPGTNTAYWGPEIRAGAPQPALNVDMDAHTNVESLSFNVRQGEGKLPVVYIQNAETKSPIPLPLPPIDVLSPPLGLVPPIPKQILFMKDTAKMSPMQALGKGLAEAARSRDAVQGSGSLDVLRYGRPLKARQLVGVRGAGDAFDGLFYVKSVTTTLKRGEFKQSFNLARGGLLSTVSRVPV